MSDGAPSPVLVLLLSLNATIAALFDVQSRGKQMQPGEFPPQWFLSLLCGRNKILCVLYEKRS